MTLICAASFSLHLSVIVNDQVPDIYDAMHLERTGRLLASGLSGDENALQSYFAATKGLDQPKLIHLLTLPIRWLVGNQARAGALTIAMLSLLIVLCSFGLAYMMAGDRAGLIAALLVALAPAIYGFSRLETVYIPLTALVTLSLLLLLRSDGLAHRGWSVLFGLAFSLGLLIEQSFPLYTALPALALIIRASADDKTTPRSTRIINLSLAAGLVIITAIAYYLPSILQKAQSQVIAGHHFRSTDPANITDFLRLFFLHGAGPLISLLALAGVLLLPKRDQCYQSLLLWLIPPLLWVSFLHDTLSIHFLLPIVPAAAVLAAFWLESFLSSSRPLFGWSLLAICLAVVCAFAAHDHLREDRSAFTFRSFQQRANVVGMPRAQRLGWNIQPVVAALQKEAVEKRIVMLFDSPYSSLVQGGVWLDDPMAEVSNLFEEATSGRYRPEWATMETLRAYLVSSDFLLIKTGFDRDPLLYAYRQNVDEHFARKVFVVFFEIKNRFELVGHFPYPEDFGPVLVYQRKTD